MNHFHIEQPKFLKLSILWIGPEKINFCPIPKNSIIESQPWTFVHLILIRTTNKPGIIFSLSITKWAIIHGLFSLKIGHSIIISQIGLSNGGIGSAQRPKSYNIQ